MKDSERMRPLTRADRSVLRQATFENLNRLGERFSLEEIELQPRFRHYFHEWPGEADFGFAMVGAGEHIRGVVWLTFFDANDPGYGFIDSSIPELSIWVSREHRGQGFGGRLLSRVFSEARSRNVDAISLSVEAGNPARRLYERVGFRQAGSRHDQGTLLLTLGA